MSKYSFCLLIIVNPISLTVSNLNGKQLKVDIFTKTRMQFLHFILGQVRFFIVTHCLHWNSLPYPPFLMKIA